MTKSNKKRTSAVNNKVSRNNMSDACTSTFSRAGSGIQPLSTHSNVALNVGAQQPGYAVATVQPTVVTPPATTYGGVFINNVVFIPGVMYVQK